MAAIYICDGCGKQVPASTKPPSLNLQIEAVDAAAEALGADYPFSSKCLLAAAATLRDLQELQNAPCYLHPA